MKIYECHSAADTAPLNNFHDIFIVGSLSLIVYKGLIHISVYFQHPKG